MKLPKDDSKELKAAKKAYFEYLGDFASYEHDAAELLGDKWKEAPSLREPIQFEQFWEKWIKENLG